MVSSIVVGLIFSLIFFFFLTLCFILLYLIDKLVIRLLLNRMYRCSHIKHFVLYVSSQGQKSSATAKELFLANKNMHEMWQMKLISTTTKLPTPLFLSSTTQIQKAQNLCKMFFSCCRLNGRFNCLTLIRLDLAYDSSIFLVNSCNNHNIRTCIQLNLSCDISRSPSSKESALQATTHLFFELIVMQIGVHAAQQDGHSLS